MHKQKKGGRGLQDTFDRPICARAWLEKIAASTSPPDWTAVQTWKNGRAERALPFLVCKKSIGLSAERFVKANLLWIGALPLLLVRNPCPHLSFFFLFMVSFLVLSAGFIHSQQKINPTIHIAVFAAPAAQNVIHYTNISRQGELLRARPPRSPASLFIIWKQWVDVSIPSLFVFRFLFLLWMIWPSMVDLVMWTWWNDYVLSSLEGFLIWRLHLAKNFQGRNIWHIFFEAVTFGINDSRFFDA